MNFYCFAAFLAVTTFPPPIYSTDGWSDPSKAQYHIQTDEGPERYFRYQTLSGQYRKEKRLEDGTVIGTYGWVDDDGYLRMRDYIADVGGYRILKTKNVFVGRNRPVNEALSIAKKVPGEPGASIAPPRPQTSSTPYYTQPTYSVPSTNYRTSNTPASVQILPVGYSAQYPQTPVFKYATVPLPGYSSTPSPLYSTPTVDISPNAIPSSTPAPFTISTAVPSSTILPPVTATSTPAPGFASTTPPTVIISSTTPTSAIYQSTTPAPRYSIPSTSYGSPVPPSVRYTPIDYTQAANFVPAASTVAPPLSSNSLSGDFYSSDPQYEHYRDDHKFVNPYIFQNGPTYPIDRNGNTYNGQSNNIGNGYNPQYRYYDGVSVTNDGFRYYIPKQYHEEQSLPGNRKSGSFGYVDPFGIRRVIYYNAGPDGFKHRKNNRYVGLNATPYDPRPY